MPVNHAEKVDCDLDFFIFLILFLFVGQSKVENITIEVLKSLLGLFR